MRTQHSVPLPDISHALQKQFLAGYHHSDAFTSFHYLFSSSDILRGFNCSLPLRQTFEIPTSVRYSHMERRIHDWIDHDL